MSALGDAVLWVFFFGWQIAPAILIVHLRRRESFSMIGTAVAFVAAVAGTAVAWYVTLTDTSSSTAGVFLLISPAYVLLVVLVVFGTDLTVRAVRRRRARLD